jgi:hypothetical protein
MAGDNINSLERRFKMELRTMYPPQKDSPTTFLLGAITSTDTFAIVGNVGLLPQVYPYPLTIGIDRSITETVMVTAVDVPTNRLTFTRGSSALPWSAGTTVGRVFTASDLKTVQDNITDIYAGVVTANSDIDDLDTAVSGLETVVGDSSSGLVKGLADEVTRAKAAETAEVSRATTAEGNLETKKINRTELAQILTDASYAADGTKLSTTLTRYNASNQQTSSYERTIPLVTNSNVGLMTPEAYNEVTALRNDVLALQQQGGRFIGISFPTKTALDGYTIPSSVKSGDFTYVIDDETQQDATTRYVFNGAQFDFAFVVDYDPIGIANTETLGIVKSSEMMLWVSRTPAANKGWFSICYGNGLFVAVSNTGTGGRVMTSPDGITWTERTSAINEYWQSVCYGNGLFVAVANSRTNTCIMTSPDGITWTSRTPAYTNSEWNSVCYGNGLFVAVAASGTSTYSVMTSPDGITWTSRTGASPNQSWRAVCYGNGLFVAVAESGTGNKVMTSSNGITWTSRTSASNNAWTTVCYGNGLFVAVSRSGTDGGVMTSPDGITWTSRTSAADNYWYSVYYGNGLFVAVAASGTGNRVMTSPDGITWTLRVGAADNGWRSVCYGNGLFVAVGTNSVMTSPAESTGKAFVEVDGTMSVIGWDDLNINVAGRVPNTLKVNNKPLTSDITLSATDVGATTSTVDVTLSTTWVGSGPYTQNVTVSGMTTSKNATVGLASTATQVQREAARNASFIVTAQTTNQITITADGDKPTIAIPISVILMP